MSIDERLRIIAGLESAGNASELVEIEDVVIEELSDDASVSSLGGTGAKTVWSEDQKRITSLRRTKLVFAYGGRLILDPASIAGLCAVCREQDGRRTILPKGYAGSCTRCGRLLCPDHQVIVHEIVYCPQHGKWPRIRSILLG